MNRIKISFGETICPRQYESKRLDIELEVETTGDVGIEADRLFQVARAAIEKQKKEILGGFGKQEVP